MGIDKKTLLRETGESVGPAALRMPMYKFSFSLSLFLSLSLSPSLTLTYSCTNMRAPSTLECARARTHTHTHTHTHTRTHTNTHARTPARAHAHAHAHPLPPHAHMHTCTRTRTRTRTRTHAHAHAHAHTRTHTRTHTHSHTRTQTQTRMHMQSHTHMHMQLGLHGTSNACASAHAWFRHHCSSKLPAHVCASTVRPHLLCAERVRGVTVGSKLKGGQYMLQSLLGFSDLSSVWLSKDRRTQQAAVIKVRQRQQHCSLCGPAKGSSHVAGGCRQVAADHTAI